MTRIVCRYNATGIPVINSQSDPIPASSLIPENYGFAVIDYKDNIEKSSFRHFPNVKTDGFKDLVKFLKENPAKDCYFLDSTYNKSWDSSDSQISTIKEFMDSPHLGNNISVHYIPMIAPLKESIKKAVSNS